MSDKKVYYFSHDFNSKYDDKILSLRMEYGWEGYGIFWAIIEDLAQSKDYKLHNSVITKLSFSYNVDINKLKNIYNLCLKEKLLIEENEYFFSESLVKRMNALDETIKKRSEAGKKGMANRWNNKEKKENNNNVITELKESYNDDITLKESKEKELNESKEDVLLICENVYNMYIKNFKKKGNKKRTLDYINRIVTKKKYKTENFIIILKNLYNSHREQYPDDISFYKYIREPQNFFSEKEGYWEQFDIKE